MPVKGFERIEDQSVEAVEEMYGVWRGDKRTIKSSIKIPYICDFYNFEILRTWASVKKGLSRKYSIPYPLLTPCQKEVIENNIIKDYIKYKMPIEVAARNNHVSVKTLKGVLESKGFSCRRVGFSSIKHHGLNHNYLDKIDSWDKGYFLGWMYSDGNVWERSVSISVQDGDEKILKYIKSKLFLNGGPKLQVRPPVGNCKKQFTLKANSERMSKNLLYFDCPPNKSFIINFSKNIPKDFYSSVILGVFEGDGTIYFKNKRDGSLSKYHASIYSASKTFVDQLSKILLSFNIDNSVYRSEKGLFQVSIIRMNDIFKFFELLYSNADCWLDRKLIKFIEFLKAREKSILHKTRNQKENNFLGVRKGCRKYLVSHKGEHYRSFEDVLDAAVFSNKIREEDFERHGPQYKNWVNYSDLEKLVDPKEILKNMGIYEKAISELPEIAELINS